MSGDEKFTHPRNNIPTAPLLAYLGGGSARQLAERCLLAERTIVRWRSGKATMMVTAEAVCETLRVHPTEVWGDDWWLYVDCICADECYRCRRRDTAAAA